MHLKARTLLLVIVGSLCTGSRSQNPPAFAGEDTNKYENILYTLSTKSCASAVFK